MPESTDRRNLVWGRAFAQLKSPCLRLVLVFIFPTVSFPVYRLYTSTLKHTAYLALASIKILAQTHSSLPPASCSLRLKYSYSRLNTRKHLKDPCKLSLTAKLRQSWFKLPICGRNAAILAMFIRLLSCNDAVMIWLQFDNGVMQCCNYRKMDLHLNVCLDSTCFELWYHAAQRIRSVLQEISKGRGKVTVENKTGGLND